MKGLPRLDDRQILIAGIALAHLASAFIGIGSLWHADELVQYLEQPYRALHGLDWTAWEFTQGTRNWFFPGIVLVVLWLLAKLGVTSPLVALVVLRLLGKGLFVVAVWRLSLALERRESRNFAHWAAGLVGLFPLMLFATHHTLSESWSLSFLLLGAAEWLLALDGGGLPRARTAGLAFAAAMLARLQAGVAIPVFVVLALRGSRRMTAPVLVEGLVFFVFGINLGFLLDWATFGEYAHSLTANLRVHFAHGGALQELMGTSPWHEYALHLLREWPVMSISGLLLLCFSLASRPSDPFGWTAALFCLVHSAVPHKEMRFLLPALPFVLVAAMRGATTVAALARRRLPLWVYRSLIGTACLLLLAPSVPLREAERQSAEPLQLLAGVRLEPAPQMLVALPDRGRVWPATSAFVVGPHTTLHEIRSPIELAALPSVPGSFLLFAPRRALPETADVVSRLGWTQATVAATDGYALLRIVASVPGK